LYALLALVAVNATRAAPSRMVPGPSLRTESRTPAGQATPRKGTLSVAVFLAPLTEEIASSEPVALAESSDEDEQASAPTHARIGRRRNLVIFISNMNSTIHTYFDIVHRKHRLQVIRIVAALRGHTK
jgi:hypothetical protein